MKKSKKSSIIKYGNAVIVNSKTVEEYGRLDAEFYLGVQNENEFNKAKAHAKKTIRATGRRLLRTTIGMVKDKIRYRYWVLTGRIRHLKR
jgi:hypothetical protein